jgi:hypothetical protein
MRSSITYRLGPGEVTPAGFAHHLRFCRSPHPEKKNLAYYVKTMTGFGEAAGSFVADI